MLVQSLQTKYSKLIRKIFKLGLQKFNLKPVIYLILHKSLPETSIDYEQDGDEKCRYSGRVHNRVCPEKYYKYFILLLEHDLIERTK